MEVLDVFLGPLGEWFVDNPWAGVASSLVVVANSITMSMPNKVRNSPKMVVGMAVLNWMAMNVFKNKNAK